VSTTRVVVLTVIGLGLMAATCGATRSHGPAAPAAAAASPTPDVLADFRATVHDDVRVIKQDEDAVRTCGGGTTISNVPACHDAIAVVRRDATAMLAAVQTIRIPRSANDYDERAQNALRDLLHGCDADDAALGTASWFIDLPGSTTTAALYDLLTVDNELQSTWT
jgi:hypothetical protein